MSNLTAECPERNAGTLIREMDQQIEFLTEQAMDFTPDGPVRTRMLEIAETLRMLIGLMLEEVKP